MTRVHRELELYYINIHRQTSKTGQHLQCTCAKCRIALFLARVTCSRSYGYYILYIHRSDWQVNKDARDRDSDYCGNAVSGSDLGDPKMQFTGSASRGVGGWEKT